MKRSTPLRTQGIRSSNPFDNLSVDQLAYIGAVAMLYNDLEQIIDEMCAKCLTDTIHPQEVLSRINGVEGKIEIVKHASKQWAFDPNEIATLGETLGESGFLELKRLRDAVVHARVFDMTTSVARTRARKGKVGDVLLAHDALMGLFLRMQEMRVELSSIEDVLARKRRIKCENLDDRQKERLEEENRASWAQALEHRSQRLSLPSMPDWPADVLNLGPLRMRLDPNSE